MTDRLSAAIEIVQTNATENEGNDRGWMMQRRTPYGPVRHHTLGGVVEELLRQGA